MKVLQIVKTSDGALFAARQVAELVKAGVEVHAVLPSPQGHAMPLWHTSGAVLHFANLDFPVRNIWTLPSRLRQARQLVKNIKPDIIHSHFFGTTLTLRYALGKKNAVVRIFQVPGPLHLENAFFKFWEISSAGPRDFWIASSHYIENLYLKSGIARKKVFVSYYGMVTQIKHVARDFKLHDLLGISRTKTIVGNVSFMYPPKFYLGQTVGLKCHEDLIDALAEVTAERDDVVGVLIGGAWGNAKKYEQKLRQRALTKAKDRIKMPGFLSSEQAACAWNDIDLAIHVPLSENCGGVIEPLLAGVPVIASRIGGLPEVIQDHVTGDLVSVRAPLELKNKICQVLDDLSSARERAQRGQQHVQQTFDVQRTASEVFAIYKKILNEPT